MSGDTVSPDAMVSRNATLRKKAEAGNESDNDASSTGKLTGDITAANATALSAGTLKAKGQKEKDEEKPKRKAEEKPKRKAEEEPKKKAEEKPKRKAEEKPKSKAEEKPKREAEEKPKREAEEKPKREAEEKPKKKSDEKPKTAEEKPKKKPDEKSETDKIAKHHKNTKLLDDVCEAVVSVGVPRKGASAQAIKKYIFSKREIEETHTNSLNLRINKTLRAGVENGVLEKPAASAQNSAATGRFLLSKEEKEKYLKKYKETKHDKQGGNNRDQT